MPNQRSNDGSEQASAFLISCGEVSSRLAGDKEHSGLEYALHLELLNISISGSCIQGILRAYADGELRNSPKVVQDFGSIGWEELLSIVEAVEGADVKAKKRTLLQLEKVARRVMRILNEALADEDAQQFLRNAWPAARAPQ